MFAVRGGEQPQLTLVQQYGGVLLDGDPLYSAYLEERIEKLRKAVDGLQRSATEANLTRADGLAEIGRLLQEKREKL